MDYFQNVDFGKLGPALEPPKPPPPKKSGFFDTLGDYGITALKGAIGVPEAAVGLADIVTGGAAGKLAEDIGFRPKEAKDILSKGYTPEQQAKFQEVQSADGFVDTAAAALRNPSTIAHAVVESAPSMLAGGVVGRGALAVAPKMSPVLAGALGEGTVAAGSAAEQIRQETADGLLTGKQAALAGATGFTTGGLSLVGGKVAKSLGIGDVDTLLAGAARNPGVQKGIVRRVLEGAAAEGVLEELPQSVVEQVLQNEALGKPLDEGVDHAAVMGMLSGGVMGAGANLRSGGITKAMQDVQAKYDAERQQVEQLRQAGDGPGADALEKTIARKVAADGAAVELDALAGDAPEGSFLTQPAFQRQYQGLREAGKTPAEAAAIGALVHRFWETGTQGGMSEKAITKAVEAFRGLPQEKMAQAFESFAATMRQTGGSKADISAADLQDAMTQGIQAVATSIYGRAASEAETDRILARMEAQAQRDLEGLRDFGDRTPDVVEPMAAAPAASVAPDAAPLPEPAAPVRPEPSAVLAAPPAPAAPAVSPVMDTPEAEAVHQAATSPTNDLPEPSDAQKAAGNYKVGRMRVAGLDISIENPQGSVRRGTSADGTAWETPMQDHYGYFRGTTAADGDKLDVFVKPGTTEDWDGPVFVVDQIDPRTGKLDEHKVVLGAADEAEAETVYRRNYSADWQGLGAITRLPMAAFKAWARSGKLKEPLGDISQAAAQPATIPAPAQADASPAPGGEAVPDAAAPVRAGGADDVQPDPAPVADVEAPAAEAAAPAAPQAPFTWTLNPQGTLAVRGDPAQIRARMKAAGVTKMMPMKGGIVVGKTQAELARAALEAGAGQAAPAAEAAAAPPAQPPKAAVAPAPAKQPRPKSKPARDARGAEEARAAYFTPGNIVRGYAGFDEVLEYRAPTQEGGAWSVKVHEVKEVDGEWVRVGKPQDAREHSTQPSAERLREGPHAKVSPAAGPDVPYTAPRADGQPFANAPARGTAKQSRERPSADEPAAPASARPSPPAPAEVGGARPQEAAAARSSPAPKPGAIENFGEQLPPARRALAARLDEELSNDDIANRSLSEIWPLSENEAIEDTFAAAVAHAARAEIPAKPRKTYKLKTWVETVKLLRSLASKFVSGEVTRDRAETMIREKYPRLIDWWSKVQLLEQLPRDQWARVDSVDERPDAITYDDGKKVAAPYLAVSIDGRAHYLRGNGTVAANLEAVRALLQANAPEKRMAFDVFTRKKDGTVFVSKQGDKRPLMEFASVEEARAAVRDRYDQLASAWEAVKTRDNITERDLRSAENRPRAGKDWRQGKDATPEQFQETFGFRGGEWGKWVAQGKGDKERQALLNSAFDALMDLSAIVGIPPKAISLNGTLGIAFGSRGSGWASAHYEPSNVVINLTKTRGAGALAHEWFHALDNYFSRMRRGGAEAPFNGDKTAYRDENYVTHRPERLMVRKDGSGYWPPMTAGKLEARRKANPTAVQYAAEKWMPDPKHPDGVRPEVEQRFADLVQALNESPMTQRALALDGRKSVGGGYWSSTLERAARAFENYVQARMLDDGYHNDFLANVVPAPDTGRNPERYPYLLPGEVKPIAEAFQTLFSEIKTRETDTGVAMYAMDARMPSGLTMQEARDRIREMRGADIGQVRAIVDSIRKAWNGGPAVEVVSSYRDLPGGGTPGARGMYMGGKVWVVATGHRAGPDLQRRVASTLAHEVIAHYGLRKILGSDFDRLLTKPMQLALASGNKPLNALRDRVKSLYRDKNGNYSLSKREESDEIAALAVENAIDAEGNFRPGYSWLKSVWARVAQFLRDMGIDVQFTQAELHGMLVQALRAVESGDRFNGGGRLVVGGDAAAREARAFHGTPHRGIEKFSTDKIGTGEGAQAFGWGLYFASKKEIAEHYRNTLSPRGPATLERELGVRMDEADALWAAARVIAGDLKSDVSPRVLAFARSPSLRKLDQAALDELIQRAVSVYNAPRGQTYEVEIPEDSEMLLWDKPMSEQPALSVSKVFNQGWQHALYRVNGSKDVRDFTGAELYRALSVQMGGDRAASDALASLGIKGIKYLDGGSRADGDGSYNYVIFSGDDVAIQAALYARGEDQTNTPAFRKWFGDSKVVDDQGKPLVVYHGTTADIASFDLAKRGASTGHRTAKAGFFFSASPSVAQDFAGSTADFATWPPKQAWTPGANVMPVYLAIKNPAELTAQQFIDRFTKGGEDFQAYADRAEREGRDGVVIRGDTADRFGGSEFDADVYVAFRPEQIKSAIGNRGTFDAENPDMRYALGEQPRDDAGRFAAAPQEDDPNGPQINRTLRAMVATDLPHRAGNKLTDYRGLGLQFLGRRQLVDIYRDMLPQLPAYSDLVQRMDADKNEAGAGADDLAHRWGKLPDERALAELMHDATLAQIDPSQDFNPTDDEVTYLELRARYGDLSDGAKEIYREARDTYTRHRENVRDAIKQRIERSELKGERKAALLKQMDDEFFKAVRGVYFPLARFGEYVIVTKNADGKTENVSRAETMSEAEATQRALRAAYPAADGYTVGKILKSKEFNAQRDAVGRGFMTELYEVLGDKVGDEKQRAELEDALGQLYLSSLPDLSWAKHGIHRKGTPGFSQDARRAFAQNVFHGARYLAKLRFSDLLQAELTAMQKHVEAQAGNPGYDSVKGQQVVDEMVKRHENLMNPDTNALSTALTSAGFVFHLGLSPASAMVNLSQTALVAYPVMGAKWGWGKASAALMTASQEAIRGKNDISGALNPEERRAYDEAVRSGVIDVTMAHDLAGIAQGEDSKVSWKIRPVMRWAGFLFHHAERFNRSVTFVAAYRLARSAGSNHAQAYRDAVQATYDGHFDYAASNRARVMQGNVARVVLLFKQYSQNMVFMLTRQAYLAVKGATPQERSLARQSLAGVLTMHAMAAGVLGLPAVTTLLAAASMIGSSGDEPWDAQVALQNYLADAFGKKPAEVMMRGFSRLTPWDISGRVALDKLLLPDVREGLEGQSQWEAWAGAALGPIGGIAGGIVKGMGEIADGQYARGMEAMLPASLRNPLKAVRYQQEGALDKTGVPIVEDVSPAAVFGQAMGFSPSEVRNASEGKSAIMDLDRRLNVRRRLLLSHYTSAVMAEDQDGIAEAREAIDAFNKAQPQRMITARTMAQSVKNRRRRVTEAEQGVYLPKSRRDALEAGRFAMAEED